MADSQQTTMAEPTYSHHELVEERLVRWYFWMALLFLGISMLGGILMAAQLIHWNPFNGVEFLSPGRWRMVHTNADRLRIPGQRVSGHAAMGRAATDAATRRPAMHLSYFIFFAWQVDRAVARPSGILVRPDLSRRKPGSPIWPKSWNITFSPRSPGSGVGRDAILDRSRRATRAGLGGRQFPGADRQGQRVRCMSRLWYFMAAFVWTFLTYAMGNFLPEYALTGTNAGAVGGLFIHDLVGLFVTPLGWGMMYYIVPIILKKPIWSTACRWSGSGAWPFSIRCRAFTTSSTRRSRCSCSTERSSRRSPSSSWWPRS